MIITTWVIYFNLVMQYFCIRSVSIKICAYLPLKRSKIHFPLIKDNELNYSATKLHECIDLSYVPCNLCQCNETDTRSEKSYQELGTPFVAQGQIFFLRYKANEYLRILVSLLWILFSRCYSFSMLLWKLIQQLLFFNVVEWRRLYWIRWKCWLRWGMRINIVHIFLLVFLLPYLLISLTFLIR